MRLPATVLCLAALAVLLLPWQLCTCSEDGTHLKPLWNTVGCAHEHAEDAGIPQPPEEPADEGCTDLVRFAGTEASAAIGLPLASRAAADLPDTEAGRAWTSTPDAAAHAAREPGAPPVPRPPSAAKTRLQV